jgi:hypothetical protein
MEQFLPGRNIQLHIDAFIMRLYGIYAQAQNVGDLFGCMAFYIKLED